MMKNQTSLPHCIFAPPLESDNLNFSYVGFIIAVFGAVPLIVATFVEVPVLWEVGLCVTLVGLFIGVVFWCTELCAEAKKFSQKKNQLSSRGRIEDSNLLQVPDRKFGNGLDSRRGSFQSDSVSLIVPMGSNFTPKHMHKLPPHLSSNDFETGSKNSLSQYSSSDMSKSDESSHTLNSSHRANGHLVVGGGHLPPPKLLLRGTGRKDDGRVVSLVQPDPGLYDDSDDSDAETVIEAPTAKPKIIQVQSCQEKGFPLSKTLNPDNLLTPTTPTNPTYSTEDETVPPLNPMAAQHRTIRMSVMPQEVEKLQRCEYGRYLLTERDKLVGIRLPGLHGGGSSMPTTAYNSPSLTGISSTGTAPAKRKVFSKGGTMLAQGSQSAGALMLTPNSNGSSEYDISSQSASPSSNEHQIISVNPHSEEADFGKTEMELDKENDGTKSPAPPPEESIVQVDPSVDTSGLLQRNQKTDEVQEIPDPKNQEEIDDDDPLTELLNEVAEIVEIEKQEFVSDVSAGINDEDDDFEDSIVKTKPDETVVQIEDDLDDNDDDEVIGNTERGKLLEDSQPIPATQHPVRPTFLPLPVNQTDSQSLKMSDIYNYENVRSTEASTIDENCGPVTVMMSSASSASTVVFLDGGGKLASDTVSGHEQQTNNDEMGDDDGEIRGIDLTCEEEFTKLRDEDFDEEEFKQQSKIISRVLTLGHLLEKLEQKQDGEVLAVVVQ